jgi:replicative DNA helicase
MANVPVQPTAPAAEEAPAGGFDRLPPQDLDAEQCVLGGMMLTTEGMDIAAEVVEVLGGPSRGVFYRPAHETVYRAIYSQWTEGEPLDPIAVTAALTETGEISKVGGPGYVHGLVQAVPTAANAAYYAEIVLDRAKRRRFIEACTRGLQDGYAGDGETGDLVDTTLGELQEIAMDAMEKPKLSVADRWADFLDELEKGEDPDALDTPWRDLNEVIAAKPGQLITIGAATSGGKSLMAQNWGTHVALYRNKPVLMFSLEMDGSELMARMTASETRIPLDRLTHRADLTEADWQKLARVSDRMAGAHNFVIDDNGSATLGHIRARARWMATTGNPPGMIIVDYLQLMEAEGKAGGQNRAQEVAAISRGLKRIAMDFRIPVIALAQFNREARDRRPQITDFKESSAIEQDSNIVLILHSEVDDEGNEARPGEIDVIVAKNRNGPRGRIFPLAKLGHLAKIADMPK